MSFDDAIELVAKALDLAGVAAIVVGVVVASVTAARRRHEGDGRAAYVRYRQRLGRAILLGLEFLVAADIIRTVAIEPTLRNVGALALIVAIRTFLSFALEVELEGRWPWQRANAT